MSKALSVKPLGEGHINDSYLVETTSNWYVSQKIRSAMDIEILEHNYALFAEACEKADYLHPEWIRNSDGRYISTDANGDHWRTYPYICGDILEPPLSQKLLYATGQGLARLHAVLQTFSDKPWAVYPMLHDLKYYYKEYINVLVGGDIPDSERDPYIEDKINTWVDKLLDIELDRTAVIHGDAKLGNILFKNGQVLTFLDLDTIMQGSLLEDLADCIRSCCLVNGHMDHLASKYLLEGYLSRSFGLISNEDMRKLPDVINKICFELGLRYYTDHISGKNKFKVAAPEDRLKKARMLMDALD
ncbi:MAG: phosphotransferase [Lachnospiraceae bacterium]|nr:phosphotransferase [Lachnospiraceae bacterium]